MEFKFKTKFNVGDIVYYKDNKWKVACIKVKTIYEDYIVVYRSVDDIDYYIYYELTEYFEEGDDHIGLCCTEIAEEKDVKSVDDFQKMIVSKMDIQTVKRISSLVEDYKVDAGTHNSDEDMSAYIKENF